MSFDPTSSYIPDSGSPEVDVMAPPDQQAQPTPQPTPNYPASPDQGGPVPSPQADPDAGSRTHGWKAVLRGALSGLESHLKGAGEGLVAGGIPGALVGAVNPAMADRAMQYRGDLQRAQVQEAQTQVAGAQQQNVIAKDNHDAQMALAHINLQQVQTNWDMMPKTEQEKFLQQGAQLGEHLKESGVQPVFVGSEADADQHLRARMQVDNDNPLGVQMLPNARGEWEIFEVPNNNKTFDHPVSVTIGYNTDSGEPITKVYNPGEISAGQRFQLESNAIANHSKVVIQQTKNSGSLAVAQTRAAAKGNGTPKVDNFLVGTDTDGNQVAGTREELAASGVQHVSKLPAADASKVVAARELVSPDGLFSLIASDMKSLGPQGLNAVGSRFNEFMSGKVGEGDDNYTRLRTHVRLLSSALMQAHVGSRGSEAMLEEFRGLADQGKMNSSTLKSALAAEYDYVHGRALLPRQKAAQ